MTRTRHDRRFATRIRGYMRLIDYTVTYPIAGPAKIAVRKVTELSVDVLDPSFVAECQAAAEAHHASVEADRMASEAARIARALPVCALGVWL